MISLFVFVVLALFGMVIGLAVLGKFELDAMISLIGAGVAASLIAAGISGAFALWIIAPQTAKSVEEAIRSTLGHPVHVLSERRHLSQDFSMMAEGAKNVDIINLSLVSFVENTPLTTLLRWIREGKKFRLLMLTPDSDITKQRGIEEGINLHNKIIESIGQLHKICEYVQAEINGQSCQGRLEVRVFVSIPYFAYLRCDDSAFLGLYYSHVPGIQSEVIRFHKEDSSIFTKVQGHFEKLWNEPGDGGADPKSRRICMIENQKVERESPNPRHQADG
jgi:hypothetical protein